MYSILVLCGMLLSCLAAPVEAHNAFKATCVSKCVKGCLLCGAGAAATACYFQRKKNVLRPVFIPVTRPFMTTLRYGSQLPEEIRFSKNIYDSFMQGYLDKYYKRLVRYALKGDGKAVLRTVAEASQFLEDYMPHHGFDLATQEYILKFVAEAGQSAYNCACPMPMPEGGLI